MKRIAWISWLVFLLGQVAIVAGAAENTTAQVSIEKLTGEKVDIILLQDESGSMKQNDPLGIRQNVASTISEDQELAGPGNGMGLVVFGTRAVDKVQLPRGTNLSDFKGINNFSREGFSKERGPWNWKTLNTVPPYQYTDIYAALETAYRMLEASDEKVSIDGQEFQRKKHVILLTDGMLDPWPGNADRFGAVAEEYAKCVRQGGNGSSCAGRYKTQAIDTDKELLFDPAGLLNKFRQKDWRIHCIGFSDGVDTAFLAQLAGMTYGHAGVAKDYTQLYDILKKIIPPAPNIVTLLVKDFCKTRKVEAPVKIDTEVKATRFKIDFSEMLKQNASIGQDNLKITLTGPSGQILSSEKNDFEFITNNKDHVVSASYFLENPPSGEWRILVESVGHDICGKVEVLGRVNFNPQISFIPPDEILHANQQVGITAQLLDEQGQPLALTTVTGKFRFTSDDGGTPIENEIRFKMSSDGLTAEADPVFTVPPGIKGPGSFEFVITNKKYGSDTKVYRIKQIEPGEIAATFSWKPDGKISLGVIGDTTNSLTSKLVQLDVRPEMPVKVRIVKPTMQYRDFKIPINWITVEPQEGTISPGQPLKFKLGLTIPRGVPFTLEPGVYAGSVKVEAQNVQGKADIPIDVQVTIPKALVDPKELKFDFWWRIGVPVINQLKLGHNSRLERELELVLPEFLQNSNGEYEDRIVLKAQGDEASKSILLVPEEFQTVPIAASLKTTSLHPEQRVLPGLYEGEAQVQGGGLISQKINIRVIIPREPFVVKYGRPYSIYVAAFLFWVFIVSSLICRNRYKKKPFRSTGERLIFGKDDTLIESQRVKYCLHLTRRVSADDLVGDLTVIDIDRYCPEGDGSYFEQSQGAWVSIPLGGLKDIENNYDGRIRVACKHKYEFKISVAGNQAKIITRRSPFARKKLYFLMRVLLPLILFIAATVFAIWVQHIV